LFGLSSNLEPQLFAHAVCISERPNQSGERQCVEGTVSHAPREVPWFWGLEFHEWQGSDGPQYGNVATLEAAKQTFRTVWDRRLKAHGRR